MKKVIFTVFALLVGCSSHQKEEAFPGEFIGADYILSDDNAKLWVAKSEQVAQCVYPNLTKIQREHFTKEDSFVHSQYVFFYPLEEIIGEQYVKILQGDEKSMGYALYQFKRFKETPAEIKALTNKQCKTLQEKARDDLAVVKGQYKSGMVEEVKTEAKNADGVATNENKFFFDIIKWGSALLL